MKIIKVEIPQYTVDTEPDSIVIGRIVDDVLRRHFAEKSVVVRAVASSEHATKSPEELVQIIGQTGTDRYDPDRVGDRYENIGNKHIDLFGIPAVITEESEVFSKLVWGFYHSAIAVHGYPVRIDIVIIYDASKLQQVFHQYEGRDDIKDDGFAFQDPEDKASAVLGVIKID